MDHGDAEHAGWLRSLAEVSPTAKEVAEVDWASTTLGPPDQWSTSLRTVVRLCLTTKFPMLIVWGSDLIKIYNDGYREMIGEKHPEALGAPAKHVWREIWHEIGPLFEDVMAEGKATWADSHLFYMNRHGFLEETWFTFSYSPIFDDDGSVGGVLDTSAEITSHVVTERRLATLAELAAAMFTGLEVTDVCKQATVALSPSTDLEWSDIYLRVDSEVVRLASTLGHERARNLDDSTVRRVVESGEPVVLGDSGPNRPARQVALPLAEGRGVIVMALNQRLAFDDGYRSFVNVAANVIGAALDSAMRLAAELGEERRINETLQRAMLKPASDLPTVAARYVPASGRLAVGGDWYDVIDLGNHRRGLIVGDCVGHDLEAASMMGQLRSASRALLLEGRSPDAVLEAMDRFAESINAGCATMICAIVDVGRNVLTYSSAGHPPPLLVRAGEASWLDETSGPPLDVVIAPRKQGERAILPGDVLVLYSDGLVERRNRPIDDGLERLRQSAVARHGLPIQAFIDNLLEDLLLDDDGRDDVVVVAKEVPSGV